MIEQFSVCPKCGKTVRGGLDEHACEHCGYQKEYQYSRYEGRLTRGQKMEV